MAVRRVHLTAGDESGWAIDEDLRLLQNSLAGVCQLSSLARAEAVHSVWWAKLLQYQLGEFGRRHVLCYADNAPFCYVSEPDFLKACALVTQWIGRSREAIAQFTALGLESRFAPYTFDPDVFHPLPKDHPELREWIQKWRIPTDRYLIANFHRDTEGANLNAPKLQKGPDAFLETVAWLHERGLPIHVLLAGPRRFWLRRRLRERGVPFTFVGVDTGDRDDFSVNILPRRVLNLLYNIADLYLISSRWEGGPHSVLESAATRCKVLSTPNGIAPDVLAAECVFRDVVEAGEIIQRDVSERFLDAFVEPHFERAHAHHTEPVLRRHLLEIYGALEPVRTGVSALVQGLRTTARHTAQRALGRFKKPVRVREILILHTPEPGTFFDAWLDQLRNAFVACGCAVSLNTAESAPDLILAGRLPAPGALSVGAVPVIRLLDESAEPGRADEEFARLHATAHGALVSSLATYLDLRSRNLLPARSVVLGPVSAGPAEKRGFEGDRPLRVGVLGGAPVGLDPQRFELHSLTSSPEPERVDRELFGKDVLLVFPGPAWAAAVIDRALALGVPVVYPAASHWNWLVWFGGLAFDSESELEEKLEAVRADYPVLARLAVPGSDAGLVDRLLRLAATCKELAQV